MPLPMHNRYARSDAGSALRGATSTQSQHAHGNYGVSLHQSRNTNPQANVAAGKEGIVQRLQRALVDVRRDRDREHRLCEIAKEKLRAAREAFTEQKSTLDRDQEKLAQSQTESTKTQEEILRLEARIEQLQVKYRFQHEDLIRKREKIQQQNSALTAAALRRERSILDVRQRLDHQRDKYQKLERKHGRDASLLLEAILSDAKTHHHHHHHHRHKIASASSDSGTANGSASTTPATGTAGTEKGKVTTNKKSDGSDSNAASDLGSDFEQHRKAVEKKNKEALAREFKTIEDYAVLPKMIFQKAKTLEMESEALEAEITRLEEVLAAQQGSPANTNYSHPHYQPWKRQRCDADTAVGGGRVGTGTHFEDAGANAAMMGNGMLEPINESRAIFDSTMDANESNLGNPFVEETKKNNAAGARWLQPNSSDDHKASSDALNPVDENGSDETARPVSVTEHRGSADIESEPGDGSEGKDAISPPKATMATELNLGGSRQRSGYHKQDKDGSAATSLESDVGAIASHEGSRIEGNEGNAQAPSAAPGKTIQLAVFPHDPGTQSEENDGRTEIFPTPLDHNKNDN